MITPRRTRLLRVPDLQTFRRTIAHVGRETPGAVILVPTSGAGAHLARSAGPAWAGPAAAPVVVTRDGFYDLLHARLPGAPRRLGAIERDNLAQASAHAVARALETAPGRGGDAGEAFALPFRLRPGLVAEMLRFYDQLRRQSQRLERFNELIEETLGGGTGDRGTDRLLAQTRFLTDTFREYERRAEASRAWDEHTLRDRLAREAVTPAVDHVVVTLADWIAEPDGLFVGDFDLLARMPGLARLDLVCTEQVLGSGFHERLHDWWPGLDEVDVPSDAASPTLETPPGAADQLWFTCRDREDELAAVAQHVKAVRRRPPAAPLDRMAVVFKRPLPYLYLADDTLGAAGLDFQASDALPLAGEPFVAVMDLLLDAVETRFARASLVALLTTPHWTLADPPPPAAIRAFDRRLRERGYLGDLAVLEALVEAWSDAVSKPAAEAALAAARALAPLCAPAPASGHLRRLAAILRAGSSEAPPPVHDTLQRLLADLADAHAAHHDPDWTPEDLAAGVHRWLEDDTGAVPGSGTGIHLLDDRAARYGTFDDITIVGLVEADWPERQARNIFYPSGLLKALGWPSEHTRRRASDARFVDLLGAAERRVAVSTITLDDEALVTRSMQLDEIGRARLRTVPALDDPARITADDALASEPVALEALGEEARAWARLRQRRTTGADPAYHGSTGPRPTRSWSVSALEAYLACPFKFFAQHVLRLEEEPEDADVMDPRQQGLFVHRVFEVFFDAWRRSGRGAITPELLDAARIVFADVVERELAALPEAEAGLERTRLLGSSAAAGLGEAVMRMEAERPVRVVERLLEHRLDGDVTLQTSDGERVIALRGKADRIDLLEDGTFRLVDYKLGWPPQRSRALQLPIYGIAAEQALARRGRGGWALGEAAYLAFKGPKRVVPLFSTPADRQKVLAEAQQRTADAVDAIARGEFPPTPEDVFLCETCSFAAVCRTDYVGDV